MRVNVCALLRAVMAAVWATVSTAVVALSHAQAPEAGGNGPEHLERFLKDTRTLRAEFGQELLDGAGQPIEAATGTFSLKRPNRFLWSYREPYRQLVVADGMNLWIHDVELGQVTVAPLKGVISSSPAMLLSGEQNVRDGFQIVDSTSDGRIDWITLVPKQQGTDFHSVRVGFDSGELAALELVDALGQTTSIRFHNVTVNPGIEDAFFEFTPPARADVIGDPVDDAR